MASNQPVDREGRTQAQDIYTGRDEDASLQNQRLLRASKEQSDIVARHTDLHNSRSNSNTHTRLHQPLWLEASALCGLACCFTILSVALIILWHLVSTNDGLTLRLGTTHYVWTYGPTAILVIVLSAWRQVDYYCKISQPWRELMDANTTPEHSVLLDYVSPIWPKTLYKACRRRHHSVYLALLAFLILKLAILVSTALFFPDLTPRTRTVPVTYKTSFSSSPLWNSFGPRGDPDLADFPYYADAVNDTGILWEYLKELNGDAPDRTIVQNSMVLQSFDLLNVADNATSFAADIEIFSPLVSCVIPDITLIQEPSQVDMLVDKSNCSIGRRNSSDLHLQPSAAVDADDGWLFRTGLLFCHGSADDARFIFSVFKNLTGAAITNGTDSPAYEKAAVVICKTDFSMDRATATWTSSNGSVQLTNIRPGAGERIDLSGYELSRILYTTLRHGYNVQTEAELPARTAVDIWPALFRIMYKASDASSWDEFLDPETLRDRLQQVFGGLLLQVGRLRLLQPSDDVVNGDVTFSQNRLHIRLEPLITMIVSFGMLTILALTIMLLVRRRVLPRSPGTIASHAAILAASPMTAEVLSGTGNMRTSQLTSRLFGLRFHAVALNDKYRLEVINPTESVRQSEKNVKIKNDGWIPYGARVPMLTMVFASALVVIVVLEVLQRYSDTHHGVVRLEHDGSDVAFYAIRICSTLVIFGVATLFNGLDFIITFFAPWSALRQSPTEAKKSLLVNYVGEMSLVALYHSLCNHHIATSLSIITTSIGSVLTIIVSGLWHVDSQVMMPVKIHATVDPWNLTWANGSFQDNGASRWLDTIVHGGTSTPPSIWNGSVLPHIRNQSTKVSNSSVGSEFTSTALVPDLDCLVGTGKNIRYGSINVSVEAGRMGQYHMETHSVFWNDFNLPAGCFSGSSRNSTNVTFGPTDSSTVFVGAILDLDIGPAASNSSFFSAGNSADLQSRGCPTLGFIYGNFQNTTALLCSQTVREVSIKTRYKGDPSNYVFDDENPPSLVNSAEFRLAIDAETGLPTQQYKIARHLGGGTYTNSPLSDFFNHLFLTSPGLTQEDLMGTQNSDRLVAETNRMYNKYMTLVIDSNFRPPSLSGDSNSSFAAQTQISGQTEIEGVVFEQMARLQMDRTSKLILQIMLAAMIVFMAIAIKLARIRRTLPRSPYSIASVMGFLADSRMCDQKERIITSGFESMSRKKLANLLHGTRFKLDWWSLQSKSGKESSAIVPRDNVQELYTQDLEDHGAIQLTKESSTLEMKRFGIDLVT
jgi:hypothetical protein